MSDFHVGTQIYSGQTALDQLDTIMNQRIMLVCDPFLNGSDELKKITAHFNTNNTTDFSLGITPGPVQ